MYQFYYDFISNYLIGSTTVLDDQLNNLTNILTHTSIVLTFIGLCLIIVGVVKWVIRLGR